MSMEEIIKRDTLRDGEATWSDAINNIDAGNVAYDDNRTLVLAQKYRQHTNVYTFAQEPPVKLTVHGTPGDEDFITLKNGYKVGLAFVSGDMTDINAWKTIQYWIASPDPTKNVYTSAGGTACARLWEQTSRYAIDIQEDTPGGLVTITLQGDEWNFTLNKYSFSKDPIVWENVIHGCVWLSHATYTPDTSITWTQNYGPDAELVDENQGEAFSGYADLQDLVNELATDDYAPIFYPGDNTDDYGGGGDGVYSDIDDIIPGGHAPTVNPLSLGFIKLYNPSDTDCRAIAAYLWGDNFDQNIKKNFASPFENIVSFGYMPLKGKLGTMQTENFVIGNCTADGNDGAPLITLNKVTTYAVNIDCGSLSKDRIAKFWNGFLDYNSVFTLWLPYVGYRTIRADDIFNLNDAYGGVRLTCWIDTLTGMIVWEVHSLINGGNKVVATFSGNCLSQMPISGANFMSMYNQQLSATVAGNQNFLNKIGQGISAAGNLAAGNPIGAAQNFLNIMSLNEQQKLIDRQMETAAPEYGRAGNMSSNTGSYGYRTPYFIKSRPICSIPKQHTHLNGIPSDRSLKLGDITGYVEVDTAEINFKCRDDEKAEILSLLKGGVYA